MSIVYNLEKPVNNSIAKYGIIIVEGWAFSTTGSINKIIIKLDNKLYYARLGIKRDDVGNCYSEYSEVANVSGFSLEIKLLGKQLEKKHKLKIEIFDGVNTEIIDNINLDTEKIPKTRLTSNTMNVIKKTFNYIRKQGLPKDIESWKVCTLRFKYYLNQKKIILNQSNNLIKAEPYEIWTIKNGIDDRKRSLIRKDIQSFQESLLISIVMPAYKTDIKLLKEAIESVINQLYSKWELIIIDDGTPEDNLRAVVESYKDQRIRFLRMSKNSHISLTTNYGVSYASGEFVFLMDHDDLIPEDSLYEVAKAINDNSEIDIIYSDDDKITMDGKRYDPQFKPDYSSELLLSYMYLSHIFVIRRELFSSLGGCRIGYEGAQDYDLALRAAEKTLKIHHIPKVLYHWRATPTSTATSTKTKPYSVINGEKAVIDAVERRGIPAIVGSPKFAVEANLGIYNLKYSSSNQPLVSIVIPNKNNKNILKRCIDSIVNKSTYGNYELIIVDNDSDDMDTLTYLSTLKHKILKLQNINDKFNFSRMVNYGVQHANGEYIILLNNDTEVISETWIEDMLVYICIEGVGIVGSKLLYQDNTVQHAGVILKIFNGIAGHAFKLLPDWHGGYLSYTNVTRNYSAVTAACFMTSKKIYEEVGAFDEENFSVSFNDVDFCLKVICKGYRIVYNPESLLYHHEGKTRGVEQTGHYSDPKEEYNFVTKWIQNDGNCDRYYNPNLSCENEKFELECKKVYVTNHRDMNILLITHNLNYEGAPLMQLNIARHLLNKGYRFTVMSREDGPLAKQYIDLGIEVIVKNFTCLQTLCTKKNYLQFIHKITDELRDLHIDLIYTNTIETFWGVQIAEILQLPVIWGIHESVDVTTYFTYLGTDLVKESIEKFMSATKVVFVANATANMYCNLDDYNFQTIKNGIDMDKVEQYIQNLNRDELRTELEIEADVKVVSIFGTVCHRKGQKVFLQAAKELLAKTDKKLLFQIVGAKESSYLNEIKIFIQENGLEKNVRIISSCDDIYQYYLSSDIFVCASYEESSPQVILEAMAFGLPIVSTNVFGIPELVRDGREALLTEPDNPNKMADLLLKIISNNELFEELRYNSYYRVKTKFTLQLMVDNYDKLFQSAYAEGENKIYKHYIKEDNSDNN